MNLTDVKAQVKFDLIGIFPFQRAEEKKQRDCSLFFLGFNGNGKEETGGGHRGPSSRPIIVTLSTKQGSNPIIVILSKPEVKRKAKRTESR